MDVNLPEEFSSRLREERKRLGMNQTEFAKAAGVHLNTQSRYEKGERAPDVTYLAAIARVGVDMAYVLGGEQGNDSRLEVRAVSHVLNVIQGELGFWSKEPAREQFEAALRDAYQAQKAAWTNSDAVERSDARLREVLRLSPSLLPSINHLEALIFTLDIVQARTGMVLSARAKADALLRMYQEEKRSQQRLGSDAAEAIIRSSADW